MITNEKNARIFQNTENMYKSNKTLAEAVKKSNNAQAVIKEGQKLPPLSQPPNQGGNKIIVSKKRSFEAAEQYKDKKVCVLNFASSVNPGGGVRSGAGAQEECLCRCSTLYASLTYWTALKAFYKPHQENRHYLHTDDIIYTPDVVVFKSDTDSPALRAQNEWFKVNVITCAAPKLRHVVSVNHSELEALFEKRIRRIARVAALYENEVLILGAFGCGAFMNPPEVVARAMKKALDAENRFETVEIAVYCRPGRDMTNYRAFADAFK